MTPEFDQLEQEMRAIRRRAVIRHRIQVVAIYLAVLAVLVGYSALVTDGWHEFLIMLLWMSVGGLLGAVAEQWHRRRRVEK